VSLLEPTFLGTISFLSALVLLGCYMEAMNLILVNHNSDVVVLDESKL
jgi:hypothetical protein